MGGIDKVAGYELAGTEFDDVIVGGTPYHPVINSK